MSKAGRQSVVLLAVVLGVVSTIESCNLSPELSPTTLYTKEVAFKAASEFPVLHENNRTSLWVHEKVKAYDDVLLKRASTKYHAPLLAYMGIRIITDLQEKISNKSKLAIVEPLWEALTGLHNALDPKGDQYDDYELADSLIEELYELIEFHPVS